MLELALALVGLVTAGIIALIGHAITAQAAVLIGLVAIALGLAVGLTTGFWYHVMLHRILSARMRLPRPVVAVSVAPAPAPDVGGVAPDHAVVSAGGHRLRALRGRRGRGDRRLAARAAVRPAGIAPRLRAAFSRLPRAA